MRKLDTYWRSNKAWFHYVGENRVPVVNDDAPIKARNSYKHYLEQLGYDGTKNNHKES